MSAKTYLKKLEALNEKINQKQEELDSFRSLAISTKINAESERVQTSGPGDTIGNLVAKIVDLDNEIVTEIDRFILIRHKIINQIQELSEVQYVKLLYRRYVEVKSLELISVEMNFTYQYIRELHGRALQEFERTYTNLH